MKCPYRTKTITTKTATFRTETETEFLECIKGECPYYNFDMLFGETCLKVKISNKELRAALFNEKQECDKEAEAKAKEFADIITMEVLETLAEISFCLHQKEKYTLTYSSTRLLHCYKTLNALSIGIKKQLLKDGAEHDRT